MKTSTKAVVFLLGTAVAGLIVFYVYTKPQLGRRESHSTSSRDVSPREAGRLKSSYSIDRVSAQSSQAPTKKVGPAGGVRTMLSKHPEVSLSDAQADRLQEIFWKHFSDFSALRDKTVITRVSEDGSIVVSVPAYPELGKTIRDEFLDEIRALPFASNSLVDASGDMFDGYTEKAGRNSVKYTISSVDDKQLLYKVTRDVVILDESGHPTGSGRTYNVVDITRDSDPILVAAIKNNKTK